MLGSRDRGLTGDFADMMGPAQLAALDPAMRHDLEGDLDQRPGSLDLSAQWRDWQANVRYNARDHGT